jgi:hypothetical protein
MRPRWRVIGANAADTGLRARRCREIECVRSVVEQEDLPCDSTASQILQCLVHELERNLMGNQLVQMEPPRELGVDQAGHIEAELVRAHRRALEPLLDVLDDEGFTGFVEQSGLYGLLPTSERATEPCPRCFGDLR